MTRSIVGVGGEQPREPTAEVSGHPGDEHGAGHGVRRGCYFLLRRWTRVFLSSLRCFFFAMRLRRFLMTEPTDLYLEVFCSGRTRGEPAIGRDRAYEDTS